MRRIALTALTALFLAGCSHYKYWDISDFHMDPHALADREEIKLLYTSRGPGNNEDLSYFIHVIAVSQKTGDTVNIFTTVENGFQPTDGDVVYNFLSGDNAVVRIAHAGPCTVEHASDMEKLPGVDTRSITKVVRDPDFDYLARNNYPSIIGWIGTYTAESAK